MSTPIDQLWIALNDRRRVEVHRRPSQGSSTFAVAARNGTMKKEANDRGEHLARIVDDRGEPEFECSVSLDEARELLKGGAVFCGQPSQSPMGS